MIPVTPAPEPEDFDRKVRQPGLKACAKGKLPPLWCEVKDDMLAAYGGICAYFCIYIEPVTGAATTDHFLPKSKHPDKVYEWSNYRLACSLANSCKGDYEDVLDPFELKNGMFAIDLISLKVVPGLEAGKNRQEIKNTIARLKLNSDDYANALREYLFSYRDNAIPLSYLQRQAPFLAAEIVRQKALNTEPESPENTR